PGDFLTCAPPSHNATEGIWMDLLKTVEKVITLSANKAWPLMQYINRKAPPPAPFQPKWSDSPIPRGKERSKPPLGWPRETDSLCPVCVKEARAVILRGDADFRTLIDDKPGEIRAKIV